MPDAIRANVTDGHGWASNSTAIVHITGPLGATLTPTNGALFASEQAVSLVALPGGGTPPPSFAITA